MLSSARAQERVPPFQRFADAFQSRYGVHDVDPLAFDLKPLLDRRFLRLEIGLLDLRYPPEELAVKGNAERLEQMVVQLLQLQSAWIEWLDPGSDAANDVGKQVAIAQKWVRAWSASKLAKLARGEGAELCAALGASAAQAAAVQRLRDAMLAACRRKQDADEPVPQIVVLAPTRERFLEWCAFLGTLDAENRRVFWTQDLPRRIDAEVELPLSMRILALEYAHPSQAGDDFTTGLDMNARESNGLQQHVVQGAAISMVRQSLGRSVAPTLEAALIQNLTIAVCGQNNTRFGGDERGKSAAAVDVFVPGGNSQGGALAGANLDSRWREDRGKDHFVRALRRGQHAGAKATSDAPSKQGHFLLQNDDQSKTHILDAPLLASAPATPPVPDEFAYDYEELFRAYRSGFLYWLQTQGAGADSAASARAFGAMLAAIAGGASWEDAAVKIYAMPLSGPAPAPPNLEWRFVSWFAANP